MLSPRLPASAVASLLTTCKSDALLYAETTKTISNFLKSLLPDVTTHPVVSCSEYDTSEHAKSPEFKRDNIDEDKEKDKKYVILHSSGSTGLPKPIDFTNERLLTTTIYALPHKAFLSLPLSHAQGLIVYTQHIYSRQTL